MFFELPLKCLFCVRRAHNQSADETRPQQYHVPFVTFPYAKVVLYAASALLGAPVVGAYSDDGNPLSFISDSLEKLPSIEVTTAQRIALRFQDQPDLTGEYHVSPDGTLSVPVIGRITVVDMTLERLEEVLTKRVSEFTGNPTYVTAEIITYRPIFVTGLVSKPGAVEWYPGLTVLQAEALAGGLYRAPEQAGGTGGFGRIEATRSLRAGYEQQKRSLASLSRLQAERKGAEQIEIPSKLASLVGQDEAEALIRRQESLLESRRNSLEKQLAGLKHGISLAREELKGLEDQSIRVDEQLRMQRTRQEKIAALLDKGLVPQERSLEGQIRISELEEKATNIAVARARVKSTAAMLEQEYMTLQTDREASIDAEIAKLEGELAQAAIEIDAATETYNRLNLDAKPAPMISLSRVVIQYTIIRRTDAKEERALARTSSYLQPGDVLLVSQGVEQEQAPRSGEAK